MSLPNENNESHFVLLPFLCSAVAAFQYWAYSYAPLSCEQLVDRRLSVLLSESFTESELYGWIMMNYGVNQNNIYESLPSDEGMVSIGWRINNASYDVAYLAGEIVSIDVNGKGLLSRKFAREDIVRCFGEPDYAHAEWIPFELNYTHYDLWFLDEGIMFNGSILMRRLESATMIEDGGFDEYTLFRPAPLSEAVHSAYIGRNKGYIRGWLENMHAWQGSWHTIKIQTEHPAPE